MEGLLQVKTNLLWSPSVNVSAISYPYNQNTKLGVFNISDDTVIANTVFPECAQL